MLESAKPKNKADEALDKYYEDSNISDLRSFLVDEIKGIIPTKLDNGLLNINLVKLAKVNSDTAILVKELVSTSNISNLDLVDQMANEIISEIEDCVDYHLKKYQKYTLNAQSQTSSSIAESTAQFFNLISLLKDVSVLGKKLFDSAPQFNVQKRSQSRASSPSLSDRRSIYSRSSTFRDYRGEEDATSEDLLAALIESSSTDDFLILNSSLDSISLRDMILAAYIYIKSHECFTLSHEIQGVVMVLRRVKFIILNILAPQNQMELIAKLLTSIGRYNEMAYVFDLFRDRDQFETLLSKGVEKTPELRIALFNYTKKNPEFYPLVTLNFSMFREIAESLEESASKRLKKLFSNKSSIKPPQLATAAAAMPAQQPPPAPLSSSPSSSLLTVDSSGGGGGGSKGAALVKNQSTSSNNNNNNNKNAKEEESLNIILIELVDAADCFSRAGCYKKFNDCERKAKLVALQLALLPYEIIIINLQQSQLSDVIVGFDSFADAYIVAEAYDYHLAWRLALFRNVILDGKLIYMEDFCKKCDLSSALVEELVLLYKHSINKSSSSSSNINNKHAVVSSSSKQVSTSTSLNESVLVRSSKAMRALLCKLDDVELKCKFYTQLNFEDSKEELLQDAAIRAHLQDIKLA